MHNHLYNLYCNGELISMYLHRDELEETIKDYKRIFRELGKEEPNFIAKIVW